MDINPLMVELMRQECSAGSGIFMSQFQTDIHTHVIEELWPAVNAEGDTLDE